MVRLTLITLLFTFATFTVNATALKPILPAKKFKGDTARAYELAAKYSSTLPQIKCHCGCMKNLKHSSLHSCFEGKHGDVCQMCRAEVFKVAELKDQGKSDEEISKLIDE